MFIIEVAAGLVADSMSLVADGLDMLADASVYGLALLLVGNPDGDKVRAAFAAGYLQLALACFAALKLLRAIVIGSDPEPAAMLSVSLLALTANAVAVGVLRRHAGDGHIAPPGSSPHDRCAGEYPGDCSRDIRPSLGLCGSGPGGWCSDLRARVPQRGPYSERCASNSSRLGHHTGRAADQLKACSWQLMPQLLKFACR